MANSSTSGIEVDPMGARKLLYRGIFLEIFGSLVLNVVVESEYGLRGLKDLGRSY